MRRSTIAVVALAACATPAPAPTSPSPPPTADPAVTSFAEPYRFTSRHPVEQYGEALPAPTTTPFDDVVIAATHAVADPHLFRACSDLVELAAASPARDDASMKDPQLPAVAVAHAWSSAGVVEPPTTPIVVHTTDPHQLIAALGTVPAGSHIGIAHDGELALAMIVQPHIAIEPFERHVAVDRNFSIAGTVVGHSADLAIDVRWQDNATMQIAPTRRGSHFTAQISCQGRPGRGDVVIAGINTSTQTVLAKFPVWCGDPPPDDLTIDPLADLGGNVEPAAAAHRMFLRLQRDRVTAGLPAQTWDDRAEVVARSRAEDLRDAATEARAVVWRKTTLPVPAVVSNMIHAKTVDEAYTKMMASPDRRANAMSRDMTAGAVGVARDPSGEFYVVEQFMALGARLDPSAARTSLERAVMSIDRDLHVVPLMSAAAQEMALVLRAGGTEQDLYRVLARHQDNKAFGKYYFHSVVARSLDEVSPPSLLGHTRIVDYIGIGVAQGHHPTLGDNTVWVVIVLARANGLPSKQPD